MVNIMGIDIGTAGVKTILIDEQGRVLASSIVEYKLYTPKPNWAEQNPDDWWKATVQSIKMVLKKVRITDKNPIIGIGLSGQMHSAVFLDKNSEVIRPAILWCDTRTAEECRWITEKVSSQGLRELVSNPALEGFTLSKIIWLRNHEPAHFDRLHKVLLPKDYIRFKLSGTMAMEISDASGTLIFDVKNRRWSKEILQIVALPESLLSPCYESTAVCGKISVEAAKKTGLKQGIPVVGGGADNTCGAIGTGVVKSGRVLSSLGTSGVVFAPLEQFKIDPEMRAHTFCHSVPDLWYMMGVTLTAAGAFKWYKNNFANAEILKAQKRKKEIYDLLTEEAATVNPGSEGLIFLPYLIGERTPHKDAHAKGVFFGFSLRHSKAHFTRATLEGITYALKDSMQIIESTGQQIDEIYATGGGAKSPFWLQMQADIFNKEVFSLQAGEGPALGAALIAGVGTGLWDDFITTCHKLIKIKKIYKPSPDRTEEYAKYYHIFRNLYPSLKDSFQQVAAAIKR